MRFGKLSLRKWTIVGWTLACIVAGFGLATFLDPVSAPVAQTTGLMQGAPSSFSPLAKQASPSVVNISTVKVVKEGGRCHAFRPERSIPGFF